MAKYKYKNSGVEWIGEIPEHWKKTRIKNLFSNADEQVSKENIQAQDEVNHYSIPAFDENCSPEIVKGEEVSSGKKIVRNGQILFSKLNCWKPRVWQILGIDETKFNIGSTEFVVLNPWSENQIERKFYGYVLGSKNFIEELTTNLKSVTNSHQRIQPYELLNTDVPLPPKTEQKAIANYLDQACQRIDRVVEIKREQIKTLRQQLKSKIHEVVTKGLNPNAEMLETGIEWIEEVPKHWARKRIKDIANLQSGGNITSQQISEDDKYPVYGGNGLRGYSSNYTHEGDFVLIGRQGALCGNINFAQGKFWASEHAVVVTPLKKVSNIWLGEILRTMNLNQYSNSAAQPGLSVEKIRNLYFVVPPFSEQNKMSDFIEKFKSEIDSAKLVIEQQIITLETYKKSLIHEVVTGKKQVT